MTFDILKPVVVLIGWTLVMWAWMIAVRMPALKAAGVDLDRKVLSDLAVTDATAFGSLVQQAKSALEKKAGETKAAA